MEDRISRLENIIKDMSEHYKESIDNVIAHKDILTKNLQDQTWYREKWVKMVEQQNSTMEDQHDTLKDIVNAIWETRK